MHERRTCGEAASSPAPATAQSVEENLEYSPTAAALPPPGGAPPTRRSDARSPAVRPVLRTVSCSAP